MRRMEHGTIGSRDSLIRRIDFADAPNRTAVSGLQRLAPTARRTTGV